MQATPTYESSHLINAPPPLQLVTAEKDRVVKGCPLFTVGDASLYIYDGARWCSSTCTGWGAWNILRRQARCLARVKRVRCCLTADLRGLATLNAVINGMVRGALFKINSLPHEQSFHSYVELFKLLLLVYAEFVRCTAQLFEYIVTRCRRESIKHHSRHGQDTRSQTGTLFSQGYCVDA